MKIQKFEDIVAWQKAQEFAVEIYATFRELKDFTFKNQICGAVISISNNIAEGFDRSSNADFARFLYIALGSCSEVRSMIYLAVRLNYLNEEKANHLNQISNEISKIITGFIKSITNN
jgi:four helix bundle protein